MIDWSKEEVEAAVADYFAMLSDELSGVPYSKAEHRRRLLPLLKNRSEQSIEFKHANISAVLIDLGFPNIIGYKPRFNYQDLLYQVVSERLALDNALHALAEADVDYPVEVPRVDEILRALTQPPKYNPSTARLAEPVARYAPQPINYLELEARNRTLGDAGEKFVINFEQARLVSIGRENLASRIEHVAKVRGDAEGFDILSFESSGAERLIEVKTTKYGCDTPFFVSGNEVRVSQTRADRYHLYRLFEFRVAPRLFMLPGALSSTCVLDPATYIASVA